MDDTHRVPTTHAHKYTQTGRPMEMTDRQTTSILATIRNPRVLPSHSTRRFNSAPRANSEASETAPSSSSSPPRTVTQRLGAHHRNVAAAWDKESKSRGEGETENGPPILASDRPGRPADWPPDDTHAHTRTAEPRRLRRPLPPPPYHR